jgi:hypothetical protein
LAPDGTMNKTSSIASGGGLVYGRRPREMRDNLCEQFFTESLILAQDERWRRA